MVLDFPTLKKRIRALLIPLEEYVEAGIRFVKISGDISAKP